MSTMFSEMEQNNRAGVHASNSLEEQRALQLAFELSMLGLSDTLNGSGNDIGVNVINHHLQQHSSSLDSPNNQINGINNGCGGILINGNGGNGGVSVNSNGISAFSGMLPSMEDRSKKSQNMTECVPVPSSEHVAEIVGRQGLFFFIFIIPIKLIINLSKLVFIEFNPFAVNLL